MKNFIVRILCLLILGILAGCSVEEEQLAKEADKTFTVKVFYSTQEQPGILKPDIGANVYIYYDLYTMELAGSDYVAEGKFLKKNSVIIPEQSYSINTGGVIYIEPLYTDKKISIVIESHFYENRLLTISYEKFDTSIVCTGLFKP